MPDGILGWGGEPRLPAGDGAATVSGEETGGTGVGAIEAGAFVEE